MCWPVSNIDLPCCSSRHCNTERAIQVLAVLVFLITEAGVWSSVNYQISYESVFIFGGGGRGWLLFF